jgi:hypothetical protein
MMNFRTLNLNQRILIATASLVMATAGLRHAVAHISSSTLQPVRLTVATDSIWQEFKSDFANANHLNLFVFQLPVNGQVVVALRSQCVAELCPTLFINLSGSLASSISTQSSVQSSALLSCPETMTGMVGFAAPLIDEVPASGFIEIECDGGIKALIPHPRRGFVVIVR